MQIMREFVLSEGFARLDLRNRGEFIEFDLFVAGMADFRPLKLYWTTGGRPL